MISLCLGLGSYMLIPDTLEFVLFLRLFQFVFPVPPAMDSSQRWQSLSSSVETHQSIQEAMIARGYVSASMFAFSITSSEALEKLIQDILLNARIPGKLSRGIRRKLEHIAACCGTLSRLARVLGARQRNEQWTTDLHGPDAPPEAHAGDTK